MKPGAMRPATFISLLRPSLPARAPCRNAALLRRQLVSTKALSLTRPASRVTALSVFQPFKQSVQPYATGPKAFTESLYTDRHREAEKRYRSEPWVRDPSSVSRTSSVIPIFAPDTATEQEEDVDMLAGIKSDLVAIKRTFALSEVPRDAYYLGLAGVLPYLATSISTFFLAWDIEHAANTGQGFVFSGHKAEALLHLIEPVQIGYGAVILSFLGAIHWGVEFAGYSGHHYRRYATGVVAPALAWPTLLLPVEYALIAQFFTFTFLYYNDARATQRGWFPTWYGTYRFVLTFIVGASIVLSLIGRGQIADKIGEAGRPVDHLKVLRASQWEILEQEEKERRAQLAAAEEEEGGDDDSEEE